MRHERISELLHLVILLQGRRSRMMSGDTCKDPCQPPHGGVAGAIDHMVGRALRAGAPVKAAIGPLLRKRPSVSHTTRPVTVNGRSKKTLR